MNFHTPQQLIDTREAGISIAQVWTWTMQLSCKISNNKQIWFYKRAVDELTADAFI